MRLIAAILFMLSVGAKAMHITPREVILVKDGIVTGTEPLTVAFNGLDGVGYALFIIRLDETDFRIAQFFWGVRPGAKPRLEKFYRTRGTPGYVAETPATDLNYNLKALVGHIEHGKSVAPQAVSIPAEKFQVFTFSDSAKLAKWLDANRFKFDATMK